MRVWVRHCGNPLYCEQGGVACRAEEVVGISSCQNEHLSEETAKQLAARTRGRTVAEQQQMAAATSTAKRSAAASSTALITHGLTLKGAQLNWAILNSYKTVENRSIRLPPGWLALHTGMGKLPAARAAEIKALCPDVPQEDSLPHGFIVGAARIDRTCEVADCAGTSAAPWAHGPICNVVGAVVALAEPIPHKGMLGMWPISDEVLQQVRDGLAAATIVENPPASLPPPVEPKTAAKSSAARKRKQPEPAAAAPNGGSMDALYAASRPAVPIAKPDRATLVRKLKLIVPGLDEAAAEAALTAHGDCLAKASYAVRQPGVSLGVRV